jgi:hypothetical protein
VEESIIVLDHKKHDRTDCNNYRGISLLWISYKVLSNILLSMLSPYIDEATGDHHCEFWHNRSTTVQILCICQMLEEKMGVQWDSIFIDFKKAYDSVRREVLYSILIELGLPMKLVRLIKMCLNQTYGKVHIFKHLSENFLIQNGLQQGDALSQLLFNFALEYAIRKVQEI